jgi:hypothetical protein
MSQGKPRGSLGSGEEWAESFPVMNRIDDEKCSMVTWLVIRGDDSRLCHSNDVSAKGSEEAR